MKYYVLHLVVNGIDSTVHKKFKSRYDAVEYGASKVKVSIDHRIRHTKHFIEYYCNDYNRFFVERVILDK